MPSGPSFTFVLPVYKSPVEHLRQQIDALAGQTYTDFTAVVVDDGCPQHTGDLVRQWVADDPRFTVITRPRNGGIAAATNTGLDAATGEFVIFVDHDDLIERRALDLIADYVVAHPQTDVVYTDERLIEADGRLVMDYRKPDWSPDRLLGQNYFNHLTCVRRSLVGSARLRSEFEPSQDFDFVLRVTEGARHVGHVPEVLYSWRSIDGSLARSVHDKAGVGNAVKTSVDDALRRRGVEAATEAIPNDPTAVRVVRSAHGETTELIELGEARSGRVTTIDRAIRASSSRFVTLWDSSAAAADASWAGALVSQARRADIGAVGPKLVDRDGRLVSAGRTHDGVIRDLHAGIPADSAGPWGAFSIVREVSSVAPLGMTIERQLYLDLGGLSASDDLDVAVAALCHRATAAGRRTLYTPLATVAVLPNQTVADLCGRDAAARRAVTGHPDLAGMLDERLSPAPRCIDDSIEPGVDAYTGIAQAVASGSVELLTSDVFDTIVWRAVQTPAHLWRRWAEQLVSAGRLPADTDPGQFATARVTAEARARRIGFRQEGHLECTIEEIWAQMPSRFVVGSIEEMIAAELDAEVAALRVHKRTVNALLDAAERGIPVVLVSDIYLSGKQLGDVLTRVGIPMSAMQRVVTSADRRRGKGHGLLADVIAEQRVTPAATLHVGDNEVADAAMARAAGASAVLLNVAAADDVCGPARRFLEQYSKENGTDAGISAAVRTTLLASGSPATPSYQLGAGVVGPLMAGFAGWAADTAMAIGVPRLHCMLREGAAIAELIGRIRPSCATSLVHASRWVMLRAAVIERDEDQLSEAVSRRERFRAEHVTEAFGVELAAVQRVVGTQPLDDWQRGAALAALLSDDDIAEQILAAAADLRDRVITYLDRQLEISDGRLVICDIGWGATIQAGLERILRASGRQVDVTGLYLMLTPPGVERAAAGTDARGYLPTHGPALRTEQSATVISRNLDILEQITTPALGTLVDIDSEGRPVTLDVVDDDRPPSLRLAQQGMFDVVDTLIDAHDGLALPADPWVTSIDFRTMLGDAIAAMLAMPAPALAAELATWRHDDVAGRAARELADASFGDALRFMNPADALQVGRDEVSWLAGLAAMDNRLLAAQLAAVDTGIPAEVFSPPSPAGTALLVVFGAGEQAELQWMGTPRINADGWVLLRITGSVSGVRVVRVDPVERAALIRLGAVRVTLEDGEQRWTLDTVDAGNGSLRWSGGRVLGGSIVALDEGGMVLISPPAEWLHRPCVVTVTFAFGPWALDGQTRRLTAEPRWRVAGQRARRLAGRVRARVADRF